MNINIKRAYAMFWPKLGHVAIITLSLAQFQIVSNTVCYAESGVHFTNSSEDDDDSFQDSEPERSAKSRPVSIKGVHGRDLKRICLAVADDGRGDSMFAMATAVYYDLELCPACKPFMKLFAQACKPRRDLTPSKKKVRKSKKQSDSAEEEQSEPSPTATPEPKKIAQREPSLAVISQVSQVFEKYSELDCALDLVPVVEYLNLMFTDAEERTKGELEYFAILAAYMNSPFEKVRKALVKKRRDADSFDFD